jgi:putative Mn2+ efflux pump MntP
MIFESFKTEDDEIKNDPLETRTLLMLSVATSIDALAAGIGFSFLRITILLPVVMIGIVTFVFSFSGVKIGSKFGPYLERKARILGGLVLIGLGVKILVEHLTA